MLRDRELAGLAMVLGKDNKIEVTITGEGSYCDSKNNHINIARMPSTPLGNMLACGLVFHEVGHKNYTTADKPNGMHGDLTNIIEDVRTEKLTITERPGTRFNLDAVTKHYAEKGQLEPQDLNHAICGKVMAYGYGRFLGRKSMAPIEAACDEMIDDAFGQLFADELEKIIKHIDNLKDTKQVVAMAKKIVDLVLNPPPPPPSSGQPQQDPSNGQQQGGGQPGGQSPKSPPTPQQIKSVVNNSSGFGDVSKMIQEEMDSLAKGSGAGDSALLPSVDVWGEMNPMNEVEAISASSRMRAKMIGLLESVKRKPIAYGMTGKKIATSQLVKMAFGDPKLFKKKVDTFATNTAVVIMCDYSGSMCGEREEVSRPAAFALHNTLYGLRDVVVSTMGFNEREIHDIVDFEKKPKSGCFNHGSTGGTPMDLALWAARSRLLARPEKRKILLLLTDGEGGNTKKATESCVNNGIEIAAIGIMHHGVKNHWPNHKIIDRIEDLPAAMFSVMATLLESKKRLYGKL